MNKKKRPQETEGKTIRVKTGCGNMYVTLGKADGELIEVFAVLGKSGGCAKCQLEAITRSISLGLKYEIPIAEYVDEFKNLRCPSPLIDEGREALSCADALAKVLGEYSSIKGD